MSGEETIQVPDAERSVDPDALTDEDREFDIALRPRTLGEFVGQDRVKEQLHLLIDGARKRGEGVDHLLFSGPPGLGKTTLARIVAHEMGAGFQPTSGPALDRPSDLAAILTNLEQGDVLRERFGFSPRLDYYSADDLTRIVARSAGILDVPVAPEAAAEIARRSRGTPRIANRLLRRVRDFAEVRRDGAVSLEVATAGLEVFEVDDRGLDRLDHSILETLIGKFSGGPVGLSTLAAAVGEETDTVEDVVEPYLLQLGFLRRTPRGRVATEHAYRHLGVSTPGTLPL